MSDIVAVHSKVSRFRFTVKDQLSGAVVSISSWTQFWFMVKTDVDDADGSALISKTLGSGIVLVDASNGLAEVTVEPADTLIFSRDPKAYVAEIQGKDSTGEPWALFQGRFVVVPNAIQTA